MNAIGWELKTPFSIVFLGDMHMGNVACDMELLKGAIDEIERIKMSRDVGIIGMGDYGDWIFPGDKRYDVVIVDPVYNTLEKQYRKVKELLTPIKKDIIGLIEGNHEETIRVNDGHEIVDRLSTDLGGRSPITSLSSTAVVNINGKFSMYVTHGKGNAKFLRTKMKGVEDLHRLAFNERVLVAGHVHALLSWPMKDTSGREKFCVLSGSFLEGYVDGVTTYVERKQMEPTVLGWMEMQVGEDYKVKFVEHKRESSLLWD